MKTAVRLIEAAAVRPGEVLGDALGLVALSGVLFLGFLATGFA